MQNPPTTIPDPTELGRALATNNDWRAIMIVFVVVMFVFVSMMFAIMVWRERNVAHLAKTIDDLGIRLSAALDKTADALWQMRLSIAESTIRSRDTERKREKDRAEDRADVVEKPDV